MFQQIAHDPKFHVYAAPHKGGELVVVVDAQGIDLAPAVAFVPPPALTPKRAAVLAAIISGACVAGSALGTFFAAGGF